MIKLGWNIRVPGRTYVNNIDKTIYLHNSEDPNYFTIVIFKTDGSFITAKIEYRDKDKKELESNLKEPYEIVDNWPKEYFSVSIDLIAAILEEQT